MFNKSKHKLNWILPSRLPLQSSKDKVYLSRRKNNEKEEENSDYLISRCALVTIQNPCFNPTLYSSPIFPNSPNSIKENPRLPINPFKIPPFA
ncbi:hypothetical protein L1887_22842 [Cichorium endivia]|nr:hypothetical protein L1887_22842 [Cichorium endivia]